MKEKKSFLLHIDSLDILEKLSDEQAGKLFKAIASHHNGSDYELDDLLDLVFTPFKNQFNRDLEKYKKVSEKRALAGKKGGKQKQSNLANASKCKQNLANLADSDNESDKDSDSDKDINTLDQSKIARAKLEEDSFEYWWKEYPKKVAKQSAFKSWKKVIKKMDDETVTELTNHIVNDVKLRLDDLATGSDKFIGFDRLHPTTYLNQERYNDDI